jgi:hypothetical protein
MSHKRHHHGHSHSHGEGHKTSHPHSHSHGHHRNAHAPSHSSAGPPNWNPKGGAAAGVTSGLAMYNDSHRPRSSAEWMGRAFGATAVPGGATLEFVSEAAEAYGHATRENYNRYNEWNRGRGMDRRSAADDAMYRATDYP